MISPSRKHQPAVKDLQGPLTTAGLSGCWDVVEALLKQVTDPDDLRSVAFYFLVVYVQRMHEVGHMCDTCAVVAQDCDLGTDCPICREWVERLASLDREQAT